VKLQEAYASENNDVGTWTQIGYKGPGEQFSDNKSSSKTAAFGYQGTNTKGVWAAVNSVALNDCPQKSAWVVNTSYDSDNGAIKTIVGSTNNDNCVTPLVPNFCKLATSAKCGTASETTVTESSSGT